MTAPTFPRAFPTDFFVECALRPGFRQAAGAAGDGSDFVIERGKPVWTGRWRTNRLTVAEVLAWQAWETSLEGSANYFLGWDALKERPYAYRQSGFPGGFGGVAEVDSIDSGRRQAVLSGLWTGGFVLTPGDHMSFRQTIGGVVRRALVEVTDTGQITANGSGVLTVNFGPKLPAGFTAAAQVDLYRPAAKFRKTSLAIPVSAEGGERPGEVTLEGVSVNL